MRDNNYLNETSNALESKTMAITTQQAEIIATEAVQFMAKKAGVSTSEILAALASGQANVVSYFVELLEIGGRQVAQ